MVSLDIKQYLDQVLMSLMVRDMALNLLMPHTYELHFQCKTSNSMRPLYFSHMLDFMAKHEFEAKVGVYYLRGGIMEL